MVRLPRQSYSLVLVSLESFSVQKPSLHTPQISRVKSTLRCNSGRDINAAGLLRDWPSQVLENYGAFLLTFVKFGQACLQASLAWLAMLFRAQS